MIATALALAAVTIPAGTPVAVETAEALSSKTSVKGDIVTLRLTVDLVVAGIVVARAGAPVVGQIAESRGTGGMGTRGRLGVRPLYLRLGDRVLRLVGGAGTAGPTGADTVVGLLLLTSMVSGHSARIAPGTRVPASVERTATVDLSGF